MSNTDDKRVAEQMQGAEGVLSENPSPVLKVTLEGEIFYANKGSQPLLAAWGIQAGACVPDDILPMIPAALSSGRAQCAEITCGNRVFSLTFAPNTQSRHVNICGLDITEQKRAEEATVDIARGWQATIDAISSAICLMDVHRRVLRCNLATSKILDKPVEEILGKPCWELFHGTDGPVKDCPYERLKRSHCKESVDMAVGHGWLNVVVDPILDEKGRLLGTVCVATDVTKTKQAEEELKYQNILQATQQETSLDGILIVDEGGKITSFNRRFADMWGIPSEALSARSDELALKAVLGSLADPEQFLKKVMYLYANRRETSRDDIAFKDGRLFERYSAPLFGSDEKYYGRVWYFRDVTDRKRAEEALRESEHFNKEIISGVNSGIIVYDRELRYVVWNRFMQELSGLPPEKVLGRKPAEVIPDLKKYGVQALYERALAGETVSSPDIFLYMPAVGKTVGTSCQYSPLRNAGGEIVGVIGVVSDITGRKKDEEKIKKLYGQQHVISNINSTMLQVKSETALFQFACDEIVSVPNMTLAWIGCVKGENCEVKLVAYSGEENGYLHAVKAVWNNPEYKTDPIARVVTGGETMVVNDLETEKQSRTGAEAVKRGFASRAAIPLIHDGRTMGVLEVLSSKKDSFAEDDVKFLEEIVGDMAIGTRSLQLEKQSQVSFMHLQKRQDEIVEAVGNLCEVRDPYTAGHERRVAKLSFAIAQEMGLPDHVAQGILTAGMLHDIGKIAVPAEILSKPGKITSFEFGIIRAHPQTGYEILGKIEFPWPVAEAVFQHHERMNGSGYPRGLLGDKIILEARILAVADVVEAMSSHRPYRPALGIDKALEEISEKKGILYDVDVVNACIDCFTKKDFKFD